MPQPQVVPVPHGVVVTAFTTVEIINIAHPCDAEIQNDHNLTNPRIKSCRNFVLRGPALLAFLKES